MLYPERGAIGLTTHFDVECAALLFTGSSGVQTETLTPVKK